MHTVNSAFAYCVYTSTIVIPTCKSMHEDKSVLEKLFFQIKSCVGETRRICCLTSWCLAYQTWFARKNKCLNSEYKVERDLCYLQPASAAWLEKHLFSSTGDERPPEWTWTGLKASHLSPMCQDDGHIRFHVTMKQPSRGWHVFEWNDPLDITSESVCNSIRCLRNHQVCRGKLLPGDPSGACEVR